MTSNPAMKIDPDLSASIKSSWLTTPKKYEDKLHFVIDVDENRPQWYYCAGIWRVFKNFTTRPCICQLQITNYKLQITNYKLQITDYKLQITNYKLQITNYKLQITNYKLQITNYKLQRAFQITFRP
jgi:hypothetical protein